MNIQIHMAEWLHCWFIFKVITCRISNCEPKVSITNYCYSAAANQHVPLAGVRILAVFVRGSAERQPSSVLHTQPGNCIPVRGGEKRGHGIRVLGQGRPTCMYLDNFSEGGRGLLVPGQCLHSDLELVHVSTVHRGQLTLHNREECRGKRQMHARLLGTNSLYLAGANHWSMLCSVRVDYSQGQTVSC